MIHTSSDMTHKLHLNQVHFKCTKLGCSRSALAAWCVRTMLDHWEASAFELLLARCAPCVRTLCSACVCASCKAP